MVEAFDCVVECSYEVEEARGVLVGAYYCVVDELWVCEDYGCEGEEEEDECYDEGCFDGDLGLADSLHQGLFEFLFCFCCWRSFGVFLGFKRFLVQWSCCQSFG